MYRAICIINVGFRFSDFLKCHIRGETLSYSPLQSRKGREKELAAQIESLVKRTCPFGSIKCKQLLEKKSKRTGNYH